MPRPIPDRPSHGGVWVKICGLRTADDVATAVDAGADAVGLVFAPGSPREVAPELAARLAASADGAVLVVGVFRDQPLDEVRRLARISGVDAVQLHGAEPASDFRALAAEGYGLIRGVPKSALAGGHDARTLAGAVPLVDGDLPGSGTPNDVADVRRLLPARWILAGGLSPQTVAPAIEAVEPWGVDVSSGVEIRRGVKDGELIRAFVANARAAAS